MLSLHTCLVFQNVHDQAILVPLTAPSNSSSLDIEVKNGFHSQFGLQLHMIITINKKIDLPPTFCAEA